jgi:hypothetical protein
MFLKICFTPSTQFILKLWFSFCLFRIRIRRIAEVFPQQPVAGLCIHAAQVQIPLGKGNLYAIQTELLVNVVKKLTLHNQAVVNVWHKNPKLEVKGAGPKPHE